MIKSIKSLPQTKDVLDNYVAICPSKGKEQFSPSPSEIGCCDPIGDRVRTIVLFLLHKINIEPLEKFACSSIRLYHIAARCNFTRRRNKDQIAAVCCYLVCRRENKPVMLLDFSDGLQVNAQALGSIYFELCAMLRVEEQPTHLTFPDPFLYVVALIDNFNFGYMTDKVVFTALEVVKALQSDWLQSGRQPGGICAIALHLGFLVDAKMRATHGQYFHVGNRTLDNRINEFIFTETSLIAGEIVDTAFLNSDSSKMIKEYYDDVSAEVFLPSNKLKRPLRDDAWNCSPDNLSKLNGNIEASALLIPTGNTDLFKVLNGKEITMAYERRTLISPMFEKTISIQMGAVQTLVTDQSNELSELEEQNIQELFHKVCEHE